MEEDKYYQEERDYTNMVCYDMYKSSAKCNKYLPEDIQNDLLYESDDDQADVNEELSATNEEKTCNYLHDAIVGHMSRDGFVLPHSSGHIFRNAWNKLNPWYDSDENPPYKNSKSTMRRENSVTELQIVALTFGVIGISALVLAVKYLKHQIAESTKDVGLIIKNPEKQID